MGHCISQDINSDWPAPSVDGLGPQEAFELGTPFARTHIQALNQRVKDAVNMSGKITLESLAGQFLTDAWAELHVPGSRLQKLLTNKVFADPDGSISKITLICFGLLHCQGSEYEKIEVLGNLIRGGQDYIAASDKENIACFKKLQSLATIDLFRLMADLSGSKTPYSTDQLKAIEAGFQDVYDGYLDDVFGYNSRISIDEWVDAIQSKGVSTWLFSSQQLRSKLIKA